jgi:hypothetical protein
LCIYILNIHGETAYRISRSWVNFILNFQTGNVMNNRRSRCCLA